MSRKINAVRKHGSDVVPSEAVLKIVPRSKNQKKFMDSILNNHITFGMGSAGSGKTYVSTVMACQALDYGTTDKIVIMRPMIEAGGEKIGYLPGDLAEKADPYLAPIYDVMNEVWKHKSRNYRANLVAEGKLEIAALAFLRGRSFKNTWIICDEAQNLNEDNMRCLLTRFGEGCKLIIIGDPTQRDKKDARGYEIAEDKLSHLDNIGFVNFETDDVVRHKIVQDILLEWPE